MSGAIPRGWFVVRGGLFSNPADVLQTVVDSIEDGYGSVASVFIGTAGADESQIDAVARICREGVVKNGQVRLTTVGVREDAGFRLELDVSDGQPSSHHNVMFSDPPDLGQAKLFIQCFDSPIPNPAKE